MDHLHNASEQGARRHVHRGAHVNRRERDKAREWRVSLLIGGGDVEPAHVVLVGDHCQLGPTHLVTSLARAGFYLSMFERFISLGYPMVMLDVQHRMHPALAAFPSREFYGDRLMWGL